MYSIHSMAISLAGKKGDFEQAADIAADLAAHILEKGLPENTLLNVNVPCCEQPQGMRVTRQGRRLWQNSIQETIDPWGKKLFWIGGGTTLGDSATDTDVYAIDNDYISVTPIHLDTTNHEGIFYLREGWQLEKIFNHPG
jgi:5'-nucleotidase